MKHRIVVVGNGWLGNRIADFLGCMVCRKRINSMADVHEIIDLHHPEIIINAIGRTGTPNIDWCETHRAETLFGNVTVPLLIAQACFMRGVRMIHLGTGCIYNGNHFFKESERPNFDLSYYSKTKYLCEQALLEFPVLQLRVRMPIDDRPSPRNLVTKLLSYENLINYTNSITIVPDFLVALKKMISKKLVGVYNVVNDGAITHDGIMNYYNTFSENKKRYNCITIIDLNKLVNSPRSNCTLSIEKLESVGIKMPDIDASLRKVIKEYVKNEKSKRNSK